MIWGREVGTGSVVWGAPLSEMIEGFTSSPVDVSKGIVLVWTLFMIVVVRVIGSVVVGVR